MKYLREFNGWDKNFLYTHPDLENIKSECAPIIFDVLDSEDLEYKHLPSDFGILCEFPMIGTNKSSRFLKEISGIHFYQDEIDKFNKSNPLVMKIKNLTGCVVDACSQQRMGDDIRILFSTPK